MRTEMVLETSVSFMQLTRLITRADLLLNMTIFGVQHIVVRYILTDVSEDSTVWRQLSSSRCLASINSTFFIVFTNPGKHMTVRLSNKYLLNGTIYITTFSMQLVLWDLGDVFQSKCASSVILYDLVMRPWNTNQDGVVHISRVRLRLWTAATNRPTVYPPHDTRIWSTSGIIWQGKPDELGENPVSVPLFSA
jgi:hypothetical protein